MAPSSHEDEGGQPELDADRVEEEEACSQSIDKLISQGISARDVKKLQDAGICTCNGLMKHNKKNLTGIKGLSKAKVDKIYEAAEKLLNQGFMTGNDLFLKVPLTGEQRTETVISYTNPKGTGRIKEIDNNEAITHIERSVKMDWFGNYKDPEESKVGGESLRSAFSGMYKHTAKECPRPSKDEMRRWCDIFVIHFPEAGRFDSLLLCNINRRFSEGGKVGKAPITKARKWSKDCQTALSQMAMVDSEISKGKSKKEKVKNTKISKRKTVTSDAFGTTSKKCKVMSDEEIQNHVQDCRLFHRSNPCHVTVSLSSMPIQLCNGKPVDYCVEDSEEDLDKEMNFLIESVNGISHDSCGYVDCKWTCSEQPTTEVETSDLRDSEQLTIEVKQSALELKKEHSAGLCNLGNTCYANSILKCMHIIPELKSALQSYSGTTRADNVDQDSHNLTLAINETFIALDQSDSPVIPQQFLKALRKKYPRFALQADGLYTQQDPEECWTQIVQTLSETLVSGDESTSLPIKELFGIGLVSSENGMDTGSVYSLKCQISLDVNHIQEGLKHGLKTHGKESKIDELPKYLTVQFCRAFWDSETKQMAKILRKVDYPMELDIYELCSDTLKQKLEGLRQESSSNALESCSMDIDKAESSNTDDKGESSNMEIDSVGPSTKLTGIYDLIGVISHNGLTEDSGHYVGWVKENGIWIEFDDDKQHIHEDKDILKLYGGGEEHMAYMCLFKALTQ